MSRAIIAAYVGVWLLAVACIAARSGVAAHTPRDSGRDTRRDSAPQQLTRSWQRRYGLGVEVGRLKLAVRLDIGMMI